MKQTNGFRRVVKALRQQNQERLADKAAQAMREGYVDFEITVPDHVIRDAFLALYRQRHPGLPEPRVVIGAKK